MWYEDSVIISFGKKILHRSKLGKRKIISNPLEWLNCMSTSLLSVSLAQLPCHLLHQQNLNVGTKKKDFRWTSLTSYIYAESNDWDFENTKDNKTNTLPNSFSVYLLNASHCFGTATPTLLKTSIFHQDFF